MADLNDDIAKYLSGKLTPAEMHALERKALDDPFLAEALEGATETSPEAFEDDISALQSQLRERTQRSRTLTVSPWAWPLRIAAGLLLIVSATVVIIRLSDDESRNDLAVNTQKREVPEASTDKPGPSRDSTENESALADESTTTEKREGLLEQADKKDKQAAVAEPKPQRLETNEEVRGKIAGVDVKSSPATDNSAPSGAGKAKDSDAVPEAKEVHAAAEIAAEQELAQVTTPPVLSSSPPSPATPSRIMRDEDRSDARKKSAGASAFSDDVARSARSARRVIKGQVTSTDGSELPGVNVNIKGTNMGTVTDINGYFKIPVDKPDTTLVFSFIGYGSTEKSPGKESELKVTLAEDATQLSEVVVTGYGVERNNGEITSDLELAGPVGGKKEFKQYLERNMQYPKQAADAKIEGRVTIQFTVETTGALSDFTVIKGIGGGCDEELMRLIKTGPKWSPTKQDNELLRDHVRVRMRFQLPKK
ncbi:MAG TPA: TonB family protein [Chryseolinea sp.]|nr:TonB family protein [Chryseolinea sp.]